ncbi:MAG: Asp-tRNA(Asn)/Glu-tRNA(Gln) amidotransferase subunit GatB [Alphaproteobacteria bacterium GM202ARS2]|nr:Asp-tRNA(Asn)/Glu-tRNA(Gln) amidotransferase subunit GatB [Alphaproteobacteria bacterium GM202ARS2]
MPTPNPTPSSSAIPPGWDVIIGLEVHAQIASNSKLFSRAATTPYAEANTQVSFIDAALPGVLPRPNQACINQAIITALGLNGNIQLYSRFDRKHYFYPDLPQGYQISQYHHPISLGGFVAIQDENGNDKNVRVTRLHMEQDAGKSVHDLMPDATAIDLNRSGVALMEIVFEPDLTSSQQAVNLMRTLRNLLRYLGSCDGNMEAGNLRADVNVSVRRSGAPLGTRCELKNLNSMRFIQQAIDYEAQRQIDCIENGETIIQQTRLFDTQQGRTHAMRSKEEAHDYRYFPDPDLPPLVLEQTHIDALKEQMPELPQQRYQRFIDSYKLKPADAALLTSDKSTADYFENALDNRDAPTVARWILGALKGLLNKDNTDIDSSPIQPSALGKLIDLVDNGTLSERIAKDVLNDMAESGEDAPTIVQRKNLAQISDSDTLGKIIDTILAQHQDKVAAYHNGKEQLFGFFVGETMRATQGKANPQTANALLKDKLKAQ